MRRVCTGTPVHHEHTVRLRCEVWCGEGRSVTVAGPAAWGAGRGAPAPAAPAAATPRPAPWPPRGRTAPCPSRRRCRRAEALTLVQLRIQLKLFLGDRGCIEGLLRGVFRRVLGVIAGCLGEFCCSRNCSSCAEK